MTTRRVLLALALIGLLVAVPTVAADDHRRRCDPDCRELASTGFLPVGLVGILTTAAVTGAILQGTRPR